MIALLQTIAAARDQAPQILGRRPAALLEWPRVTAQLAAFCLNRRAAAAIRRRRPYADPQPIALDHALADELRALEAGDRDLPIVQVGQALALLERPAPIRLEGPDLVHIAAIAEELDALRGYLLDRRDRCPRWGEAAVQAANFGGLCSAVRRALDTDGRILDGASALLARLRHSVTGQERAVRQEVTAAMGRARAQGWTTAPEVALRGDRFCLPLRSGDGGKVQGIVHDRSATGATLFIEPAGVVALANALAETRLVIAAEEARILFELNRAVEQAASFLQEAMCLMLLVDEIRAGVRWSLAVGASRPVLDPDGNLRLCGGRHPLLMEAMGEGPAGADRLAAGRSRVVPLDLELPRERRALVISGPNAGGKSVALKTVGVSCLLAQCGWDVPARSDTVLPLVRRLLVDLGDDQSIAAALSSFSAHLEHLRRFLDEAGPGVLVLCDEIGGGTDPQEGTALAFAVLEQLVARRALVLASTHFGLLKAAVHDHPAMINAAMDFDEDDLRPLFTIRVGDPGTSHAFDIAARMGFGPELLQRARSLAGQERVQVEKLLADLDRRARDLAITQQELSLQKTRLELQNRRLEERLGDIARERADVLENARRRTEVLLQEGRRAVENAVREIRSTGADKQAVKGARDRLAELAARLVEEPAPAPAAVREGQQVRIPHLNLVGQVVEVRGDRVIAVADGLRLTLGADAVEPLTDAPGAAPLSAPRATQTGDWAWGQSGDTVAPEIDLRGLQGQEAWDLLDKLIDRAIPAGLESVTVIHGFGTGRLRDHLHARLKADRRVASFTDIGPGLGGGGATRVVLADGA